MSFRKAAELADAAAKNADLYARMGVSEDDYEKRALGESIELLAQAVAELSRSIGRAQP